VLPLGLRERQTGCLALALTDCHLAVMSEQDVAVLNRVGVVDLEARPEAALSPCDGARIPATPAHDPRIWLCETESLACTSVNRSRHIV